MFVVIIMMIMIGEEHAGNGNCHVRLFSVGWFRKEKKEVNNLAFTEHLALCQTPCFPCAFSWHHQCPHFTGGKTEPQEGHITCTDRSWQGQVWKPDFPPPGLLFQTLGAWSPEGFRPCPFSPL